MAQIRTMIHILYQYWLGSWCECIDIYYLQYFQAMCLVGCFFTYQVLQSSSQCIPLLTARRQSEYISISRRSGLRVLWDLGAWLG